MMRVGRQESGYRKRFRYYVDICMMKRSIEKAMWRSIEAYHFLEIGPHARYTSAAHTTSCKGDKEKI